MNDTIAAISTGIDSNYSVIKISGPNVRDISSGLFSIPDNFLHKGFRSTMCPVMLYGNEVLCSIWFMKGPRSYTGEDCVEIHLDHVRHVAECLLEEIFDHGARLAKNGEFTMRAYLNGKISLTDAENIAEIIYSESPESLIELIDKKDSLFKDLILRIENMLLDLLSDIEASIDFIEEDISFISSSDYTKKVNDIDKVLTTIRESRKISASRPVVMICGPSNAGKSTLFNHLLGNHRSITYNMEGTTRDVIKGEILVQGVRLTLLDTPGFLATPDDLNSEAIDIVLREIKKTPFIIYVCDSRELDKYGVWLERFCFKPDVYVASKKDLLDPSSGKRDDFIYINSLKGIGIESLMKELRDKITNCNNQAIIGMTSRQFELIYKLNHCINNLKAMNNGVTYLAHNEIIADEIRQSLTYIAEITGRSVNDEVLSRIFSRFCIGK